ncbi:MAG: M24 family metallopeptidase [Vicinamibacterales bacterium]
MAQGLKDRASRRDVSASRRAVRHMFVDGSATLRPAYAQSGTPISAGCRIVKDEHELALMKRDASAVTLKAYEAAWKALKPGMTQNDFQRLISQAHDKLGYAGGASAQTAEFSALPHGSITPQVIKEGDVILIDAAAARRGRGCTSRTSAARSCWARRPTR